MSARPTTFAIVGAYALLCLIWGTTWSVIRAGLVGVPPFTGVALRFAIASILLIALCLIRGVRLGTSRRERALWLVNGVFAFSASYGIVYWAEQWIPSGLASVLFATYPIFVAMLAHVMLPGERVGAAEGFGILLAFAGCAVIFSEDLAALGGPRVAVAAAVMLLSPAVSAVASVAVKKWGGGVHPLSLAAVPMGITGGIMAALAWATERHRQVVWDARSLGALIYLAVLGSAVTFSLYYWLLSHLPAKRLALIAFIIPIVAVAIGWILREPFTPRMLAGSALVIASVAITTHQQMRAAHT